MPQTNDDDWASHGRCRGMGAALFFENNLEEQAKAICFLCPVIIACRDYAEKIDILGIDLYGVWGGTTKAERYAAAMQLHKASLPPVECGTMPGYRRHRHLGEPSCDPCKAAYAAYAKEYKRKAREKDQLRRSQRNAEMVKRADKILNNVARSRNQIQSPSSDQPGAEPR